MRLLLIILLMSVAKNSFSDKLSERDIVGSYNELVVLEGGVWALIALGTLLRGTWSLEGDTVTFVSTKEQLFSLYGRKLLEPDHLDKIQFSGLRGREVWVDVNPKKKKSVKRLYQSKRADVEPSGPSTYVQKKPIKSLLLAQKEDAAPLEPEHTTFLFKDLKDYNDFIVFMPPPIMVNSQTFTARYYDGKLTFLGDGLLGRKQEIAQGSLPDDYQLVTLDHFARHGLFPDKLSYVDSIAHYGRTLLSQDLYPYIENPTVDSTQDYINLTPVVGIEVVSEKKGSLIHPKCDGREATTACYE